MADTVYAANSTDTVGTKDANATATQQQAAASDSAEVKGPDAEVATVADDTAEDEQTEAEAEDARDEVEVEEKDDN